MKFTIPAGELLAGLKSVQSRTKARNIIPILNHIRFEVVGPRLTLMGHDLESCSEAFLAVDQPADGACAVPGEPVARLIGSLAKEVHVSFELQVRQIAIEAGKSRYKLPVMPVEDFPDALAASDGASVDLTGKDVAQLFSRPQAALRANKQHKLAQGGFLHMADGTLAMTAMDGFHLLRCSAEARLSDLTGLVVPAGAMAEIEKIGKEGGRLTVSSNLIAFNAGDRRYCSKLIDVQYTYYQNHLPELGSFVTVDREELLAAVRRLAVIAAPGSEIQIGLGDGELTVSLEGLGDGIETVAVSGEIGDVRMAIAPAQFAEALSFPNGETIEIHFSQKSRLLRIVDPFEPGSIFVEATRWPRGMRVAA